MSGDIEVEDSILVCVLYVSYFDPFPHLFTFLIVYSKGEDVFSCSSRYFGERSL